MTKRLDPASEGFAELAQAAYVNLATERRNGNVVDTPIWIAPLGQKLVGYSAANAGKVKRIQGRCHASLACCNYRGGNRGVAHTVSSRVVDEADLKQRAYEALKQKYGWQMRLANLLARLAGRLQQRAVLEFTLIS